MRADHTALLPIDVRRRPARIGDRGGVTRRRWAPLFKDCSDISTKEASMGDTHRDPTDHFRTTQQHAGESMIDVYCWPGLFLISVGVMALIGCVAAAGYEHHEWILTAGVTALVAMLVGASWIAVEHRRVLRIENRWWAEHAGGSLISEPRRF
jgi:hypothetical protein